MNEASALLRQGDQTSAFAKYQDIIEKYYASTCYIEAMAALNRPQ
jgi:hypothetical protein